MSALRKQSGVIPFRIQSRRVEVLLITSSNGGRWQFPKGRREPGLTAWKSAEQEALEEAGVLGVVHPGVVSRYRYKKGGKHPCEVTLFAMPVLSMLEEADWEEAHLRQRKWVALDEATDWITQKSLRACLKDFHRWLRIETVLLDG